MATRTRKPGFIPCPEWLEDRRLLSVLLQDDFNDNSLDPSKWAVGGVGSVVERNQHVEIDSRGYLISRDQYDPASVPLRITGTWKLNDATWPSHDFMQILTRSDGVPSGGAGETRNGIEFHVNGNDFIEIVQRLNGESTALTQRVPITLNDRDSFSFVIEDDGQNLSLSIQKLTGDMESASVTATSTLDFADHHVVFHNREFGVSFLDDVVIASATVLPDIQVTRITTEDADSVTVDYRIDNADIIQPTNFELYRSNRPYLTSFSRLVSTQTINPNLTQDAALKLMQGTHSERFFIGTTLTPDTARPYIVFIANPLGAGHVAESDDAQNNNNNYNYFKKYLLGVITHGYTVPRYNPRLPLFYLQWFLTRSSEQDQQIWMDTMKLSLLARGYDTVYQHNWMANSSREAADQATGAGRDLYLRTRQLASELLGREGHDGDVVDIHFIGHSRGAVVVSQALQDIDSNRPHELRGGYLKMTMLDAHPANNFSHFDRFQDITTNPVLNRLSNSARNAYFAFQNLALDPRIVVPANVRETEILYQRSETGLFGSNQKYINLWGHRAANMTILSAGSVREKNLTTRAGTIDYPRIGPIGHGEVITWYQGYLDGLYAWE